MSNYTPSTNFATKDALVSGNPAKIIKGTEISAEFNAIQTAIASKYDSASTVPVSAGGTGATNATDARTNIGAAASGANSDITSLSGLTGAVTGPTSLTGATAGMAVSNVSSINGGQLAGLRNRIINGKMDIAQRGTSFAAIATSTYSLDRWWFGNASAAVITASQQADVPSSNEFQSSLRLAVTTADTSIAAGDLCNIQQRIEGYNARDLIGRTFTLSFWVRSSKTGTHCVAFKNAGTAGVSDRSYVAEYTISAANTWEYKSITVTGGLITAGTWDWTNGTGLSVLFNLAAGSTFQTTAGAWQTGAFNATANQVNCLDTIGNIFAITGVQLEVGSTATPFEHRPYGMELALCQRYYYRITPDGATDRYSAGWVTTATTVDGIVQFPVTMRTAPTALEQSGAATDYAMIVVGSAFTASSVPTFVAATKALSTVRFTYATGGLTGGQAGAIRAATTAGYLGWSAEL